MQGAPYSADLIHRGHENPRFEVDIQHSSLREFHIRDNKQDVFVELSSELLLDRTFDLQAWYAQKMHDLKVNKDPELAENDMDDDDDDSDPDDDDNQDGSSPPGGTNSFALYNHSYPPGDPGSPQEGSLSWLCEPEEVEAEWDQDMVSETCLEEDYDYKIVRAKQISQINHAVEQWANETLTPPSESKDLQLVSLPPNLEVYGIQVPQGSYAGLQCNATVSKDFTRMVPKPVVIVVHINGHPACALLYSGLLEDFMSTSLADQLKVRKVVLKKPLPLQLAIKGSF